MISQRIVEEMRPTQVKYNRYTCDRCERSIELAVGEPGIYQNPDGWVLLYIGNSQKLLCAFCVDELDKWMVHP